MGRLRIDRLSRERTRVVTSDGPLIARCHLADRPLARLIGLLGTPDLAEDEGLWLEACRSVHTWGMRIAIAVAFLDADGSVVRVVDPMPPWRMAGGGRIATTVVEARAGRFAELRTGQRLVRG